MSAERTFDVGDVHVLTMPGGVCVKNCPHPDHGEHTCDTGWFDRTLCPEPCGYMHSYCTTCERRQDPCAHFALDPATVAKSGQEARDA